MLSTKNNVPLHLQGLEGHNIEFSCPAASTQRYLELPDCIFRSRRPLKGTTATTGYDYNPRDGMAGTGLLQRTCNQSDSREKACSLGQRANSYISNSKPSRPASIQFRRTLPAPSHLSTNTAPAQDNSCDGAAGTRLPPAHAARATPEKRLAVSSSEPTATPATRNRPDLRASNSGELPPCHHLRRHKVVDPFFLII